MTDVTNLTEYPIGTSALAPLSRNASDVDKLVNGSGTVENRAGGVLTTWKKLEADFNSGADDAIAAFESDASGVLANYAAFNNTGAWTIATAYQVNDLWSDSGSWYLVVEAYTSGATAADDIAGGTVALYQSPGTVWQVGSIAEIEVLAALEEGQALYLSAGGRSGTFHWDGSDLSTEVAADTLQGVYIAPSSDATGASGAWVRKLDGYVTPEMFGWESSLSQSESTTVIQACWDSDATTVKAMFGDYKAGNLIFPNKDFVLTGKFKIYCDEAPSDTYYLAASYKHINNVAEAQTSMSIVPISGDPRDAVFDGGGFVDHSLISQSWNSKCAVRTTGAILSGCVDAAETRDGTTFPTSSKVNNRWLIISNSNGGCGFYGRDGLRNNGTDGTILPGSQIYGNADAAVYIEAGAGWDIHCRTYGNGAGVLFNGYGAGTLVHDSYIDDGDGVVSALPETGFTYSYAVYGSAAIGSNKIGLLSVQDCDINGPVSCGGSGDSSPYGVRSKNNNYQQSGYIYHQYFGSSRKILSDGDSFTDTNPFRFHNGSSTGQIVFKDAYIKDLGYKVSGTIDANTDTDYTIRFYDDYLKQTTKAQISPSAFSVDVDAPPMPDYWQQVADVVIEAHTNWNSGLETFYKGTLVVGSKVNGSDSIIATLHDIVIDGAEWTTPPAVSVSDDGAGNATITLTADQSSPDGFGRVTVSWL